MSFVQEIVFTSSGFVYSFFCFTVKESSKIHIYKRHILLQSILKILQNTNIYLIRKKFAQRSNEIVMKTKFFTHSMLICSLVYCILLKILALASLYLWLLLTYYHSFMLCFHIICHYYYCVINSAILLFLVVF